MGRQRAANKIFCGHLEDIVSADCIVDSIRKPTHKPLVKSGKSESQYIARQHSQNAGQGLWVRKNP